VPWARQIVCDDDVAKREFGDEDADHVGGEGIAVHRSVKHPGCDHAGATQAGTTQAGDKGGGLPVPVWQASAEPFAPWRSAIAAHDVG
jgi:hypothetical protein